MIQTIVLVMESVYIILLIKRQFANVLNLMLGTDVTGVEVSMININNSVITIMVLSNHVSLA